MATKLTDLIKKTNEAELEIAEVISKIKQAIENEAKSYCFANNNAEVGKAEVLQALHKLGLYKYTDPYSD